MRGLRPLTPAGLPYGFADARLSADFKEIAHPSGRARVPLAPFGVQTARFACRFHGNRHPIVMGAKEKILGIFFFCS